MSSLSIPVGNTLEIISVSSIRYQGTVYTDVTSITLADGTVTTLAALLDAAGGVNYSSNELKRCVKVEAYDPDSFNRGVFSCYSTNSRQTGKNSTGSVPGGVWIEMFNFLGDGTTNGIFNLWQTIVPVAGVDYVSTWLGFKLNYGTTDTRSYVMTQVNDFLEESIPGPPVSIDVTYMHDAKVAGQFIAPAPLASAFYVPIKSFKLYRSAVTADGFAVFQRVPADPASVAPNLLSSGFGVLPHAAYVSNPYDFVSLHGWEIVDRVLVTDLLETLPSLDWDAPPPRKLMGLTAWRNGMVAAFADNLLYLCEPYRPFAWPEKYITALPAKILGLAVDDHSLIVVTDREPFIFLASHPSNVSYDRLEDVQAGLAPDANVGGFVGPTHAITETGKGVLYAGSEGPVQIASGRGTTVARALFTREEWATRYRSSFGKMRFAYSDGHLLCYFTDGGIGFYLSLADADPQFTQFLPSSPLVSNFTLPHNDSLYVVSAPLSNSTIERFADETVRHVNFRYQTRDVILARPENLGALQVIGYGAEGSILTINVYGDAQLIASVPLTFTGPNNADGTRAYAFRLPGGVKARRWGLILESGDDQVVQEAYLAPTMSDLALV